MIQAAPVARRHPAAMSVGGFRSVVRGVGRVLTAAGLLAALFLGYEFLLTGLSSQRTQQALLDEFKREIVTTSLGAPGSVPREGSALALLSIPRLGLEQVVVEGTRWDDLKSGSGHLRSSPLPGEYGNSVIAGRRTTYGAPFRELDRLGPRDAITVTTGQGSFVYTVAEVHPVRGGDPDPLGPTPDSRLTLVTSDPPFVASGRLAVVARLRDNPIAIPLRPRVTLAPGELGLAGDPIGLAFASAWGLLLGAAVWLAWRYGSRWPVSIRFMLTTPIVVALIVLLFSSLDRVLPGTL